MANKRSGGSSRNGRDSSGKRLGAKKFSGELIRTGNILYKRKISINKKYFNTNVSKDHSIHSMNYGKLLIKNKKKLLKMLILCRFGERVRPETYARREGEHRRVPRGVRRQPRAQQDPGEAGGDHGGNPQQPPQDQEAGGARHDQE